ncbi:MAG: hypothetical protein ACTHOG_12185 [Marmoricola sp.]
MSGRFFLAFVVPVAYLLALALAALTALAPASGTRSATAATVSQVLSKRHPSSSRRIPAHSPHRARHRARLSTHRWTLRRATPAPAQQAFDVISRSDVRLDTVPTPHTSMVVRIAAVTTPRTMQAAIDACRGPVEIDWNSDGLRWGWHPSEIAEHDFCGGSRFESLRRGQRVEVIGGTLGGTYVVNGNRRYATAGSSAEQLNGIGDIAMQTCLAKGLILIGLDRIG